MKKYSYLLMLFLALLSCKAEAGLDTLYIKTSAQCGTCKETIERGMLRAKGVASAQLDVDTKMLMLVFDADKTNPVKLRKAVTRIGYDADSFSADPRAYNRLPGCCQKGGHDSP
jgi:mercuric ion binding protein